ncbi:MAG: hypothetical protein ABFC96_01455 [Thermoguttaceae bacterium]
MQFTLRTFFLLFVVLWSSLGMFGVVGIGVFVDILLLSTTSPSAVGYASA